MNVSVSEDFDIQLITNATFSRSFSAFFSAFLDGPASPSGTTAAGAVDGTDDCVADSAGLSGSVVSSLDIVL